MATSVPRGSGPGKLAAILIYYFIFDFLAEIPFLIFKSQRKFLRRRGPGLGTRAQPGVGVANEPIERGGGRGRHRIMAIMEHALIVQ